MIEVKNVSKKFKKMIDNSKTKEFYADKNVSFKVEKEEDAIYSGDVPIKPSDDEFNYEFTGFVKDDSLDGDFSFIATFKETPKNDWNKVTWF